MKIQILGTGCPKCKKLADVAESTARNLGIDFEMQKITDINEIVTFGVMSTPALVVNGDVKVAGRIPLPQELEDIFRQFVDSNDE